MPAATAGLAQAKNLHKATCPNVLYACIPLIAYATITIFGKENNYRGFGRKTFSFHLNTIAEINILRTLVLKMHVFINHEGMRYNPTFAGAGLCNVFEVGRHR